MVPARPAGGPPVSSLWQTCHARLQLMDYSDWTTAVLRMMSKARDFSVRPLLVIWEMTQSIVDPQNEQLTFLREALG